jgi:serine-type D-Ala-D-Ala carboxypeptidase/endopeptidase (penicillin-binding protein 4)
MKAFRLILAVVLVLGLAAAAPANLEREIRAILQDESLKEVETGIRIVRLGSSPADAKVLYAQKSEVPFMPASNMKLITSAAALGRLGEDFKFETRLLKNGEDLVVIGDGDPTIGDLTLLRSAGWGVDTLFRNWAAVLKERGITSVRNVIVDDSVFDEEFYHPGWSDTYAHFRYAAQVGGLNLNVNTVDFAIRANGMGEVVSYTTTPDTKYITVRNTCVMGEKDAIWFTRNPGGNEIILRGETPNRTANVTVTIHDPTMFFAKVLAETLQREGIAVTGEVKRDRAQRAAFEGISTTERGEWMLLAIHETPLASMLGRFNKDSVNLYGESLCKRMGFDMTGQTGTWENGTAAVGEFLKGIGIAEEQFRLSDGSGLARANHLSTEAIMQVLIHSYHQPTRQLYIDAMAVGGGDGTLRNRFRDMPVSGRVFAKSGYIGGVSALSGYLQGKDGEWYAFSILMNGIAPGSNATMRGLQDRIVNAIEG